MRDLGNTSAQSVYGIAIYINLHQHLSARNRAVGRHLPAMTVATAIRGLCESVSPIYNQHVHTLRASLDEKRSRLLTLQLAQHQSRQLYRGRRGPPD